MSAAVAAVTTSAKRTRTGLSAATAAVTAVASKTAPYSNPDEGTTVILFGQ
jgi:hypothetical protein